MALPKFDSAVTIAAAAKGTGASAASADSILNLALVGAARTSLDLGDPDGAKTYASQVAAGFEYRVYYGEGIPPTSGVPTNPWWNALGSPDVPHSAADTNTAAGINYAAGALWVTVGEAFQGIKDPRMPMTPNTVRALDGTKQYVANKPASFGGFVSDPNAIGAPMTPGASIRIASSLEAQYIIAEADGGVQSTLDFVNAQRAANGQPASTAVSPSDILADLRDQRSREFYLDGHRLGDIRRYKAQYGVDYFPSGPYPGSATGDQYGTRECFVIPISEINSNPNL
jgi:hypothetical protein